MHSKNLRKKRLNIHICELTKTSESNLPKLAPNARFYSHWKRNFQKLILVSVNHPLTRNFLRSYAGIAFEKRRHGRSLFWWVIHPCSTLRFSWDLVMTFTFIYIFITVPYILAFHRVAKNSDTEILHIVYPAYAICIIDIIINFITGFSSPDGHEIFLDPVLTSRNYIRGYFFIDFLSSIPYTWLHKVRILPPGPDSNSAYLILEFLPLLKLLRIVTLRLYVKQITTTFSLSHAEERAIWSVLMMILLLHWASCLSHMFPCVMAHAFHLTMQESEIYLITSDIYKKSDPAIYLTYLYIGVSNFFGSSSEELSTLGRFDSIVRSIILMVGKVITIYITVIVLQLAQSIKEPELKYQRVLHQVKEYIRERKLPNQLKNKLIAYYEYRFQGSYFKENAIHRTLSNHLTQEIMINSSRGLIETAPILQSLPRHIIVHLMGILRPVIYLNEDIIYKCEDEGDCMFFVVSGTVALITFHGKEICHEKDGGYFGEAAVVFPDRRRLESVIALEVCELLSLNFRDFKRMFSASSAFHKELEKLAKQRQEKIAKLMNVEIKVSNNKQERENEIPTNDDQNDTEIKDL